MADMAPDSGPDVPLSAVDSPTETSQPDLPEPDPLAVFAVTRRWLRLLLYALGYVAIGAAFLGGAGVLAIVTGWAIVVANPDGLDGMDDAASKVAAGQAVRTPTAVLACVAVGAFLLLVALLWLAGRWPAPGEASRAMRDDFTRRLGPAPVPFRLGRPPQILLQLTPWVLVPTLVVLAWLAGADVIDGSPSLVPLRWGLFGNLMMAVLALLMLGALVAALNLGSDLLVLVSLALVQNISALVGVPRSEVRALKTFAYEQAKREAEERWPARDRTEVRLATPGQVVTGPLPRRLGWAPWRERTITMPQTGLRTTIEALAATLLAAAVRECAHRGLVRLDESGRRVRLESTIGDDVEPVGLARLIAGHHRVGLALGRRINGTLKEVLTSSDIGGTEDPHWGLIRIAWGDAKAGPTQDAATVDARLVSEADKALRGTTSYELSERWLVQIGQYYAITRRRRSRRLPPD
jgi:hypothetical protein